MDKPQPTWRSPYRDGTASHPAAANPPSSGNFLELQTGDIIVLQDDSLWELESNG